MVWFTAGVPIHPFWRKYFLWKCSFWFVTQDSLNDKQITFRDIDWGDFVDDESFKPQIVSMAEDSDVTFEKLRSVYFEHNFSGQSIFHGNTFSIFPIQLAVLQFDLYCYWFELFICVSGLPSSYPRHGEDQLLSLFSKLDSNSDGLVALTELDSLSKTQWEEVERLEESLSVWIDGILSKDESSKEELWCVKLVIWWNCYFLTDIEHFCTEGHLGWVRGPEGGRKGICLMVALFGQRPR